MEKNFTCVVSMNPGTPEKTAATIEWHLYNGGKKPMANISCESMYGGDFRFSSIDFSGGFMSCSAWCDAVTGKGALAFADENKKTVAVLYHKGSFPKPGTRWTLQYDHDFYHIDIQMDKQRNLETILVYDPVPELRGEVMCHYPLAYIENPKDQPGYSGLVTQRLPMQLCMAIVWLPFVLNIAIFSR